LNSSIVVYLITILLNMNIGYYDKGYVILSRKSILKRYFEYEFWIYFLTLVPMFISIFTFFGVYSVFNFLAILNVMHIDKLFSKYFEICSLRKKVTLTIILKLFYILLKVLFLVHIFACIFLALGYHT